MNKAGLKRFLRRLGMIKISDGLRYRLMYCKNFYDNRAFKKEFPQIAIPPDYMMYESFNLNYRNYYNSGNNTAQILKRLFEKYINFQDTRVLDWGCGPSRVIRHFSKLCPSSEFFGTDYNSNTINWNKANIKDVTFELNKLTPPTKFKSDFFNMIYGMSVFTHLSIENHRNWIDELYRISKNNAILILTTHGDVYRSKLMKSDRAKYDSGQLVVQAKTKEGHRTFAAYHPTETIKSLFADKFEVIEHISGKVENWGLSQDKWIVRVVNKL